ncbi:NAD-glutamate dehydrogenase domain-containing protein [Rothia aerolata]|uniref:Glutamate dehydrogenase n=1 Tax=Rothia aerolata TaxID=1812262 RepID=A0A917ISG0_9MICC|nr:NAD-glutamate dehydrogenase domain-containing protein [Rothia aerolata]GGH63162.1 hypothetical protein GCM10007359_14160 [Rothia aerolata]
MTDHHNLISETDEFSRLVSDLQIAPELSVVFRAYSRYLLQLGVPAEAATVSRYLRDFPEITGDFVEFFELGFDPARQLGQSERVSARDTLQAGLSRRIEKVQDDAAAAFFSALLEVQAATVRTNFYQKKPTLALKMSTQKITRAPQPRPLWEIWVYSPKVEGTHLRFGMVSRGGLRWSDRPEDFRTEILGLVKAQRVKNAVIIPNGSKGGFVPKGLPDRDREKELYSQMGVEAYKLFIGSLLDVTDNLQNSGGERKIKSPENVVALDGPDHYLVVAADKGTATFSDTANTLSTSRGFWLGDAFASGGSVGFDHKDMGITARGAWESVKRHFASLQHDSQSEDFTMVGVGGMAGDVFGNGALLSEHIRLIAAFDSRHIFIDPQPDAASSYRERQRLFNLLRAYWTDYNPELISAGGGVFSRSADSIPVAEPVREALGLAPEVEELTPSELIRAIVAAPVDLFYTGGTGTYVRASDETDEQVGDSDNDSMRITASQLRAKVVAEGGNLGLTQRARIEAARRGVLINTDALDNSAGVETSDHEVNLKILIDQLIAAGELDESQRAPLIESLVDEVGRQVLESNINQNVLLQAERLGAGRAQSSAVELLDFLEERAGLDRQVEFLPTTDELDERREAGEGVTSPELAVVLAYTKIWLTGELLDAKLGRNRDFSFALDQYFPAEITERYGRYFWQHPLREQIIATRVANEVIDTAGIAFVLEAMKKHGVSAVEVVRAFYRARAEEGLAQKAQQLRSLAPTTALEQWIKQARELFRLTEESTDRILASR